MMKKKSPRHKFTTRLQVLLIVAFAAVYILIISLMPYGLIRVAVLSFWDDVITQTPIQWFRTILIVVVIASLSIGGYYNDLLSEKDALKDEVHDEG
jgi:hypothetical protein